MRRFAHLVFRHLAAVRASFSDTVRHVVVEKCKPVAILVNLPCDAVNLPLCLLAADPFGENYSYP